MSCLSKAQYPRQHSHFNAWCAADAKILGGAISQATDQQQSYDTNGHSFAEFARTLAGNIVAAVSQANLPPQVAIQGYAYALSYSQNDLDNEILLSAVAHIGQLAQLLTEASLLLL